MKKLFLTTLIITSVIFSSCLSTFQEIAQGDPFKKGGKENKSFYAQAAQSIIEAWDDYKYPIKKSSNNGVDPFHLIISNFFFSPDYSKNIDNFQRYAIYDEEKNFFHIFFNLEKDETIDGNFYIVVIEEPSNALLDSTPYRNLGITTYKEDGTLGTGSYPPKEGSEPGTIFIIHVPKNFSFSDFQQATKKNPNSLKFYYSDHYK